jgi:hypothetical protein
MSEPDEDPPVTGGRDLPESLVWRPNKLSEAISKALYKDFDFYCDLSRERWKNKTGDENWEWLGSKYSVEIFECGWLAQIVKDQAAELAAQAEEIRRLREALDYAQSRLAAKVMDGD